LWFGTLIALVLLIAPGAIVARIAQLNWPIAIAVGPALTYGVVALAIIPYGALGIPWNGWTALAALAVVCVVATVLQLLLARFRDTEAEAREVNRGPAILVAGGVLVGVLLIGWAAFSGLPHWQSIPSTWDAVWHANTVRWILETGQASSTHMGELRNVETHALLYYPSVFHAQAAVLCQLIGAAATTGYTLTSLATAIWLFPVSAAVLTWRALRTHTTELRTAAVAATAAALSASFTAVPYVEFDVAAMPNLAAYGVAIPTMALITSTLRHRDRIPVAVLALVGVFSVHITGGIIVLLLVAAWWLFEALWHPVRSRFGDLLTLAGVGVVAGLILLPQFLSVTEQEDIIAGHSFLTYLSMRHGLFDAVFQHSRHLNDFPYQWALMALAVVGGFIMLVKKVWWPLAVWLLLIVINVDAGTPLWGPFGVVAGAFGEFFYKDPRRIAAATTPLVNLMAAIALVCLVAAVVALAKRFTRQRRPMPARFWSAATAALLLAITVAAAGHYFPRHRFLFGDKYDSILVDQRDLDAMAYLAKLPGARNTLIGNSNVDGTSWMYAVAGLHPLWTHYDYPVQMGPGYHRYNFWAFAKKGDTDPRVPEAIKALNIRYVLASGPTIRGFKVPEGLYFLDKSPYWTMIYDNGGAQIYEWHGDTPVHP
jgi:D-galactosaminyltransferase